MLKQLSIFAENKKGTMQQITQILFENDVNIRFRQQRQRRVRHCPHGRFRSG